ncbi:MAG: YqgE/AlgH family protein [Chitinophagales bacterium]|nr:YqgE/AlgH family protein [Chitinophagaceae bacterium]MCB9065625.1 YqgE/AlgH family protein [Chitinophagales bacterium]
MEFLDLHKLTDSGLLSSGKLLIAQPMMTDSIFSRSVVFLCEHSSEGSLGFILNKPTDLLIGDLLPDIISDDLTVKQGGPVQLDTLHILHRLPDILGGTEVSEGVYWGGSFDVLRDMIDNKTFSQEQSVNLFIGYSGWSSGQLEQEMKENSWLISKPTQDLLFDVDADDLWKQAIKSLGKEYTYLQNIPTNPQLN